MIYVYIGVPIFIILIPVFLLIYLTITEYKPKAIEDSTILRNNNSHSLSKKITLTTLNTGYSSLDKDQDFFVEGGKNSRCFSNAKTMTNLSNIARMLKEIDSDFFFLQEVDEPCRRSCYTNQVRYLRSRLNKYNASFAYNYKVKYVPIPLKKPMGSAKSGLITLSKGKIDESKRYQFAGDEGYPRRLFFLKRCMMVNKYKVHDDKELILINIHLSAYDKGGLIRKLQIEQLIKFINEISKENKYVIIGGDWNHLLDNSIYKEDMPVWVSLLPDSLYDTSYRIIFDKEVNTVRSEDTPYVLGRNFETIIDGFLVSPNIHVLEVEGLDYKYKYTDHNPVKLTFKLK